MRVTLKYTSSVHKYRKRYKHKRGFGQVRFATVPDLKKRTVMGKVRVNNKKGRPSILMQASPTMISASSITTKGK